jgi:hypothetical protein
MSRCANNVAPGAPHLYSFGKSVKRKQVEEIERRGAWWVVGKILDCGADMMLVLVGVMLNIPRTIPGAPSKEGHGRYIYIANLDTALNPN